MKLWIKTPFPGETVEQAPWHKCETFYETKILWPKHKKLGKRGLPVLKQEENPDNT